MSAIAPNALIAAGGREPDERPGTGKPSAETARLPDAARDRTGWRHDLLPGPDISGRRPEDLQAGGIVLPDFGVAQVSAAAVVAVSAAVAVVVVDAVRTSG